MNWWQRLSRRRQMEEELDNEVQFHIEQHSADLVAHGMDPENARRQARLVIGGPEQVKESCRDARGPRWLEELLHDSRYAARALRQNPGFAAVNVLILALGLTGIGGRSLVALSPSDMPRLAAIQVNMPVLIFGFGVTVLNRARGRAHTRTACVAWRLACRAGAKFAAFHRRSAADPPSSGGH